MEFDYELYKVETIGRSFCKNRTLTNAPSKAVKILWLGPKSEPCDIKKRTVVMLKCHLL